MHKVSTLLGVAAVCLSYTLGQAEDSGGANPDAQIEALRKGIQQSERKVLNLQVSSTFLAEVWNDRSKKWEFGMEDSLTAWYIGVPGSKTRIDFHKHKTRWVDGPAPFTEDTFTAAYNGKIGQVLFVKQGSPASPINWSRGEIDSNPPGFLESQYATGWLFSIYGFFADEKLRFSAMFDSARTKPYTFEVATVTFNGVQCIKLTRIERGSKASAIWYFDSARNYALLGCERRTANGVVWDKWVVDKLAEPSPGVFYPIVVHSSGASEKGEPVSRATYTASEVIVNDPKFSDDVFTVKWPPGTPVFDKMTGRKFVVTGNGDETIQTINRQVERLQSEVSSVRNQSYTQNSRHHPIWLVISIALVVILVGIIMVLRKKR